MALFVFAAAMNEHTPTDVLISGEMQADLTNIDDIVAGVIRVNDKPPKENPEWDPSSDDASISSAPYKVYNIGNNNPVKLMGFISTIEKKLGKTAKKNMLPIQAGDVPSTYADVHDLIRDLDYKPETSIEEGIDKFVDWYLEFFEVE